MTLKPVTAAATAAWSISRYEPAATRAVRKRLKEKAK